MPAGAPLSSASVATLIFVGVVVILAAVGVAVGVGGYKSTSSGSGALCSWSPDNCTYGGPTSAISCATQIAYVNGSSCKTWTNVCETPLNPYNYTTAKFLTCAITVSSELDTYTMSCNGTIPSRAVFQCDTLSESLQADCNITSTFGGNYC